MLKLAKVSLVVINEADCKMRNHLHDLMSLLLEREDRRSLLIYVAIFDTFNPTKHIFKVLILTTFYIALYLRSNNGNKHSL